LHLDNWKSSLMWFNWSKV